jgi:uncharacterized membrane protein YccC
MKEQNYGSWAFIIGLVLAIILGLFGKTDFMTADVTTGISYLLVIIGLIVGFYNMNQKEVFNFLIVAIALLTVGAAGLETIEIVKDIIPQILKNIVAFVAPAALIMALKALYDLGYKK